jgi:hypothetical protein
MFFGLAVSFPDYDSVRRRPQLRMELKVDRHESIGSADENEQRLGRVGISLVEGESVAHIHGRIIALVKDKVVEERIEPFHAEFRD